VLAIDGAGVDDAFSVRDRIMKAASGRRGRAALAHRARGQLLELPVRHAASAKAGASSAASTPSSGRPPEMVTVRQGPIDALVLGAQRTWDVSALTVRMLGRMLIGEASLKNLSGPLTIADYAGQSVQQGLTYYLASWPWSASAWGC
jgi:regulator of sigma E protease